MRIAAYIAIAAIAASWVWVGWVIISYELRWRRIDRAAGRR